MAFVEHGPSSAGVVRLAHPGAVGRGRDGPSVTVCVCTHDSPAYLRDCLASLRSQTAGRDGLGAVIVDSASPPWSPERPSPAPSSP